MAHAGQRLDGLGEVVGEDSSVLAAAPVATHPGQGGAAHGVVDGLLSGADRLQLVYMPDFSLIHTSSPNQDKDLRQRDLTQQ